MKKSPKFVLLTTENIQSVVYTWYKLLSGEVSNTKVLIIDIL